MRRQSEHHVQSRFARIVLLFGAGVFVLLLTDAASPEAQSQDKQPAPARAVTLTTEDFLKVPAGVTGKDFTVAKAAPVVDVCIVPGLDNSRKGTLWSSWGDGCVHSNGKYYTSMGDHLGIDATSHVYEYDPATKMMRRIIDVLQAIGHMLGLYGHGKIHSGIYEGDDGCLYFTTYWGKPKEVEAAFTKGFKGSLLLRYNPKTNKTENLGAIVPQQGLPASAFDAKRQLLYFHAVYKGNIAVYDIKAAKVRFLGGADQTEGQRSFLVSASGKVYFSSTEGRLGYYDPASNKLGECKVQLPASPGAKKGDVLRASARPTKSGLLYGMTAAGRMFSFDPKAETVKDLGANWQNGDYTAAMVLSPDEKYLYFAPGAHGSGNKTGAPVIQYTIATGQRKVLAFLKEPLLEKLKYNIGGTYNLQIDGRGEQLFFTFNGANPGQKGTFGQPAVVVVHVPVAER
jgi:hypothetical protein